MRSQLLMAQPNTSILVTALLSASLLATTAVAANHLDTPTVIANPQADIGDIFAWMSPDAKRLNLVMTIVGHTFSDKLSYTFHIDSGARFGETTATTTITCRFPSMNAAECLLDDLDRVSGDPSHIAGLTSEHQHFRLFAGLRDDPFFNNVKGFRAGYDLAAAAVKNGAQNDAAGCPVFDRELSQKILTNFRQVNGAPATNFLNGWTPSSIVISIDRNVIARGGGLLAIWGVTASSQRQIDRMGRPLTENALLGTLGPSERADELKERFNSTTPAMFADFVPEIEHGLGVYDGFDAVCGNQLLAKRSVTSHRYKQLAELLADDRLWVNSKASTCNQFFAVELAHLAGRKDLGKDCGGRTITDDSLDVYRSLLVNGTTRGVEDGVDRDDHQHSLTEFPFLAAPDATPAN